MTYYSAALTLEQPIINAIQNGDIEALKNIGIVGSDITKPFAFSNEIKIISKSQKCPFKTIKSPSCLVLAILCEQKEILQFFLTNYSPLLNVEINGWKPIHFAAVTGDYQCLKALVEYEYIQANIDAPLFESSLSSSTNRTTALHIAVSNRRHAQAIILLSDFKTITYGLDMKKYETPKKSEYSPANVQQISENGNTPLHNATKINDLDMIKILLFHKADPSIKNKNGKTPLDIAKENNYLEAAKLLEEGKGEDLTSKYITASVVEDKKDVEKKEEKTEKEEKKKETYVTKGEINSLNQTAQNLLSLVQQISSRVQQLEEVDKEFEFTACVTCGRITEQKCPSCGDYCCEDCLSKKKHICV